MLDELRRRDWVPPSLRRLERDMKRARESFTAANERPPTHDELAQMLSLTPRQLRDKEHEIANADLTSLSSQVASKGDSAIELVDTLGSDDETTDPQLMADCSEVRQRFRRAFETLPERDREVAILLYVKNLTLRDIGEVLGVSESRVSQIHSRLKQRVGERLTPAGARVSEVA